MSYDDPVHPSRITGPAKLKEETGETSFEPRPWALTGRSLLPVECPSQPEPPEPDAATPTRDPYAEQASEGTVDRGSGDDHTAYSFPPGEIPHQYVQGALDVGNLLVRKNTAYGDSFRQSKEFLRLLYPDGIGIDQMPDALCVIRIVDKLFRIATKKDAFGESPYSDIAGYAILGMCHNTKTPPDGK